jgi:uncharacterized protein (TIGR02145 family)
VFDCAGVEGGTAVLDCSGVCGGEALLDICGICDNDSSNDCVQDCNGEWGGEALLDICGICDNDSLNDCVQDCNGEWGGEAFVNVCDYCVSGNTGFNEYFCGTVTDIDGNVYNTIIIGNQYWMIENLKTTQYKDGSEISTGYSNADWIDLSTGAYTVYPDFDDNASQETCEDNCADVYGNLYNWYAVDDERGICPENFHVSFESDWQQLEVFLCVEGGKTFETCVDEFTDANGFSLYLRGTDEGSKLAGRADLWTDGDLENNAEFGTSGFTALPGGSRYSS